MHSITMYLHKYNSNLSEALPDLLLVFPTHLLDLCGYEGEDGVHIMDVASLLCCYVIKSYLNGTVFCLPFPT